MRKMIPIVIDTESYLGISRGECVNILEDLQYKHARVHVFAGVKGDPESEIEIVKLDHNFFCYIVAKLKIHFAAKKLHKILNTEGEAANVDGS